VIGERVPVSKLDDRRFDLDPTELQARLVSRHDRPAASGHHGFVGNHAGAAIAPISVSQEELDDPVITPVLAVDPVLEAHRAQKSFVEVQGLGRPSIDLQRKSIDTGASLRRQLEGTDEQCRHAQCHQQPTQAQESRAHAPLRSSPGVGGQCQATPRISALWHEARQQMIDAGDQEDAHHQHEDPLQGVDRRKVGEGIHHEAQDPDLVRDHGHGSREQEQQNDLSRASIEEVGIDDRTHEQRIDGAQASTALDHLEDVVSREDPIRGGECVDAHEVQGPRGQLRIQELQLVDDRVDPSRREGKEQECEESGQPDGAQPRPPPK